jgi:phenylpropionate dioxygenase-like ring-hydroxylating dioxygenase large terminal subunit
MNATEPVFNHPQSVAEGWYWLCRSSDIRQGKVRALRLLGRDLAVYRGADNRVAALHAYCPHMGAHLAEGRVEGNALRCFFHRWRYEADGRCSEIPCLDSAPPARAGTRSWPVAERYGMVWLWTGEKAAHEVPEVPELAGQAYDTMLANRFEKRCHPNVVLINAIDEQHFHSVHHLPGAILNLEPLPRDRSCIEFHNKGKVPTVTWLGRQIARFYRGPLTYSTAYWYGSLGTVTFGPDLLHLYLMFALRRGDDGKTEGQTIVFTKHRPGALGWLLNRILLHATAIAGRYFAHGDTRVFQTIRFDLKTPIAADRAVLAFIRHLNAQQAAEWSENRPAPLVPQRVTLHVAQKNNGENLD